MVKVIRPGWKNGWKKEIECGKCGALLSYTNGDIHSFSELEFPGVGQEYYYRFEKYYIVCPECGSYIYVEPF